MGMPKIARFGLFEGEDRATYWLTALSHVIYFCLLFLIVGVTKWIWPDAIPFSFFAFWTMKGSWGEVLKISLPIFAWGGGLTLIGVLITHNSPAMNRDAKNILSYGFLVSFTAGIMEELIFRWM